mgnify:CR=1 FL=1
MDWKRKLVSRKFWVAVSGFVVGVITLFHPGSNTSQVAGVIMALGSVIAYLVGEGMVDSAAVGLAKNLTGSGGQEKDLTEKTNGKG